MLTGLLETEWRVSIVTETFLSEVGEPSAAKGSERSSSLRAPQWLSDELEHDTSTAI
jgi:hypothetical protein